MHFNVYPETYPERSDSCDQCESSPAGTRWLCPNANEHPTIETRVCCWKWALVQASGKVICECSASGFSSEAEARSDIAAAKKSMKGAWRCKVVVADAGA